MTREGRQEGLPVKPPACTGRTPSPSGIPCVAMAGASCAATTDDYEHLILGFRGASQGRLALQAISIAVAYTYFIYAPSLIFLRPRLFSREASRSLCW